MALQVGELFATLGLDTEKFDKGLDKSEGKANKFGGVLSTALGFVAGGAITKGLDIVGGAIGGIADAMINGNAEFEKYETQFGVLLGSTDAAKERLAELAKFGASTPFELPELVKADKVLTSFGIHSEDMLTIVGDVAAGTGASFEDMALLMGKFSAGATGEVLSRFQEMGVATKDELAKMGIEFDKAGSMTTPVAKAMPILEQLMKDKFGGMMTAQSQTFEGMVSNLQDWMGQTGRIIGAPLFEVLKDKLGVLLTFLSSPEVQTAITNFATGLATGIGATIDFISTVVIPAFTTAYNTLAPIISAVIPIINTVMDVFAQGGTSIDALGADATWLGGVWNQLKQIIDIAVKLIQATIVPIFNAIAKFILEHGDDITRYLTNTWNIIKAVINIALAIIKGVLKVFLAVVTGDWKGAWDAIKQMFNTVWENIKVILRAALDNIKIILSVAWDAIKGVATSAWNFIRVNIIEAAWNGIKNYITSKINEIKSTLSTAWESIKGTVTTAWNSIKTGITTPFDNAKKGLDITKDAMKSALSGAWSSIKGTAESMWGNIKSAITGKFDDAKKGIDGTISDIKGALSGAWSTIESGVRSAWEGIASAAGSGFSGITGKIKGIVNDAISMVNRLIDAYNEVAGTLGLGTLSHISRLARGTLNFAGGPALVGEFGPELVMLPKGARVIPNTQTENMIAPQKPNLTINQYITQAASLADEMDMALAYYNARY